MKTVIIEDKEYEVSDNAEWIAQDYDGTWCWFIEQPHIYSGDTYWSNGGEREKSWDYITQPRVELEIEGWEDSLQRVGERPKIKGEVCTYGDLVAGDIFKYRGILHIKKVASFGGLLEKSVVSIGTSDKVTKYGNIQSALEALCERFE